MKFQIGTQFYWALNQLTKKPKSLQRTCRPAKPREADDIHLTTKHLQKTKASQPRPAKGSAHCQKSKVDVTPKQKKNQLAEGSGRKTTSTVTETAPVTTSLKETTPPSEQGVQKRKMDAQEATKSQPKKKPKADDSQKNKTGTAKKGWKGYVEISREEFERDLALKEQELEYKALPHKRGHKPKIDNIYTV